MHGKAALFVMLILVCGCASAPTPEPAARAITEPSPAETQEAIRNHERFSEPIYVEIWGHAQSPTALLLTEQGLLELERDRLQLTEEGERLGVKQSYYQSDVQVYHFPVGHRELVQTSTRSLAGDGVREVSFEYRNAPNALGASLLAGGSRLDRLDAERVLSGKAVVNYADDHWEVIAIEL